MQQARFWPVMKQSTSLHHLLWSQILVTIVQPRRWALNAPRTQLHKVRSVSNVFLKSGSPMTDIHCTARRTAELYNFIPYPCLLNFRVKLLLSLRPCNQHAYPNTSPIRYLESVLLPKVRQFISYLISHLIIFYCRLSDHCTIPGIALPLYLYFLGFSDARFPVLILLSCKSIVSKRNWFLLVL